MVFNNIQLFPSYEVNEHQKLSTRGWVFSPKFLAQGKTSRGLTTWYSPHMKAITVLFCRIQQNNFRYRKCNYGIELEFSTHFRLSGVVDKVTTYYLPLHHIYVWVVHQVISLVFRKTSKLSYYFYIVKKICKV